MAGDGEDLEVPQWTIRGRVGKIGSDGDGEDVEVPELAIQHGVSGFISDGGDHIGD